MNLARVANKLPAVPTGAPSRRHGAMWELVGLIVFMLFVNAFQENRCDAAAGKLEITVVDAETNEPIACRMHLKNAKGKPQRGGKAPFYHDHFVIDGKITLNLPKGEYSFVLERGPEYSRTSGHFSMDATAEDSHELKLRRVTDMAKEGWWSGELHVHRPLKDIELLMRAEDLHVAPVITWWNDKSDWAKKAPPENTLVNFEGNRYYDVMAGEDEREGGALLYFGLKKPLMLQGASREFPSPLTFLEQALEQNPKCWIDIEKPFWWDVPVWLAHGKVQSIGIANNHMCRDQVFPSEAWGKPRDEKRLPPPLGNGEWSQQIYYHILNCGMRIPPSAGSASGVLPNPVGYNRMYVYVEPEDFSYDTWWERFKKGNVVVTNGPLIRPFANSRLPGHVFQGGAEGDVLSVDVALNFTSADTISYFELVHDGEIVFTIPYEEFAKTGHFPPLRITEPGWFLVRAIADVKHTYRFASSAPWYVEFGENKRRISKSSAQFFLNWVNERIARVQLDDPAQREQVLKFHHAAREFWQRIVARANAD